MGRKKAENTCCWRSIKPTSVTTDKMVTPSQGPIVMVHIVSPKNHLKQQPTTNTDTAGKAESIDILGPLRTRENLEATSYFFQLQGAAAVWNNRCSTLRCRLQCANVCLPIRHTPSGSFGIASCDHYHLQLYVPTSRYMCIHSCLTTALYAALLQI